MVGVDTARYKVLVFVVSAVFASLVGSLFAHKNGFITPDMSAVDSVWPLILRSDATGAARLPASGAVWQAPQYWS